MTIVKITSARFLGAFGFLKQIFEIFDRYRTVVDILTTSEVSLSLSLEHLNPGIIQELQEIGSVEVKKDLAVVSVVGEGLLDVSSIPAIVFNTIKDIPVLLISQGSSSSNLTFVVDEDYVESAITRLHAKFFENWIETPPQDSEIVLGEYSPTEGGFTCSPRYE